MAAAIVLAGCGTKYQEMGFSGGVSAQRMTSDVVRISARGNGYTSNTTVQDYALLKAAETTKEMGGSHFAVISAEDASRVGTVTTPGTAQTSVHGHVATTTYTPGSTETFIKPGKDAYIRVLRISPGSPPPAGAISADEIIKFVGSRVERG
jgi:Flp pilus assembly protein TadG